MPQQAAPLLLDWSHLWHKENLPRNTLTPLRVHKLHYESQHSLIYCWGLSKAVGFSTFTLFLHTRFENSAVVPHHSRRKIPGLHSTGLHALVKIKDCLWQLDFCRNFPSAGPRDRNWKTREAFNLPAEGWYRCGWNPKCETPAGLSKKNHLGSSYRTIPFGDSAMS